MKLQSLRHLVGLLMMGLLAPAVARQAAATTVLFTADTEGHVESCQACPTGHGLGGLARRATLVAGQRQAGAAILVDGGNALFGPESLTSHGAVVVAAYNAMGYDAVNLSAGDFPFGRDQTLATLKDARFDVISANLLDEKTGAPLFKPYVVRENGAAKLALIGVTERPAAADVLPQWKTQLAGIRIDAPLDAIAAQLPAAKKAAASVGLVYYGSAAGLRAILGRFPNDFAFVLAGGMPAGEAPAGGKPPVISSDIHGKSVARYATADGKTEQLPVAASLAADAGVERLVSASVPKIELSVPQPAAGPAALLPGKLAPGKSYPVNASAENRGVRITVLSARLAPAYGAVKAADGRQLLVLTSEFENLIPLTPVKKQLLATEYKVPNLADNLYLVLDDSRLARLVEYDEVPAGCLPVKEFHVDQFGQKVRGNLIFEVPQTPAQSVDLRFYDYAHGNAMLALQSPAVPLPAAKPLAAPKANSVVEAAVFSVAPLAEGADKAPPGMQYVAVELRARSVYTMVVDAHAFDPKAAKGAKLNVGTVADWKESAKYLQAVVDGEHAYAPLPQSDLAQEPRFLPDVMTGGQAVFLLPIKRQSLELRCDFPNAALPDGKVQRPEGLTLALEGKRPAPPKRTALVTARDEAFDVAVVNESAAGEFAGIKADEGQKFIVLDVVVKNIGQKQEFFQPKEQLKFVAASGDQVEIDDATLAGVFPPAAQMYIPAGDSRAFQMAYRVGAEEMRPRLAYAAVTEGASKVLALPALAKDALATAVPADPKHAGANTPPAMVAPVTPPAPRPPAPQPPMKEVAVVPPRPKPAPTEVAAGGAPMPRDHGPARGIEGVGLTAEQVNTAIDKGAKALWEFCKKKDADDGVPFGKPQEDVLCALALVHSNAHKKIPEFDAALRAFLSTVDPTTSTGRTTYANGLLCMLLEAYGDPTFEPKLRDAARWLTEAQGPDGTWTYDCGLPNTLFAAQKATGVLQVSGGLPPAARGEPWKRLSPWPKEPTNGDNSCTQYAILGLQSAVAGGIRPPVETWKHALATSRARQATESGGWDYRDTNADGGYGSMTAAGICAVAICTYQTGNVNFARDPAVLHGLGWLDQHFSVSGHPKYGDETGYHYYWLYAVERVGRILDTEFIGAHEWYPEGAAWIVGRQTPDGLWFGLAGEEKDDTRLASSFALLFLTRATPPLKPIEKHGPGSLQTAVVPPDNSFYIILDASGSMLDEMDGRMKFDIARGAVQSLVNELPPNCDVALRVYGHRKTALMEGADEDTELKIPRAPLDKPAFTAALQSLRPRGKTPLALSLKEAIKDLGEVDEKKPVTLILLTDGGEDTIKPRGNPLQAAAELGKVKNVRFHIVGFDINQPEWAAQLETMSQKSGGKYWPAARAADLDHSLRNAVLGVPEGFAVLDSGGHETVRGPYGKTVSLPEGAYTFRTVFAGRAFDEKFNVSPGETTSITFDASAIPAGAGPAGAPAAVASEAPAAAPGRAWPKFCAHCGAALKDGQKFCAVCGNKVEPKP